jgi:hypothetical protein
MTEEVIKALEKATRDLASLEEQREPSSAVQGCSAIRSPSRR